MLELSVGFKTYIEYIVGNTVADRSVIPKTKLASLYTFSTRPPLIVVIPVNVGLLLNKLNEALALEALLDASIAYCCALSSERAVFA